MADQVDSSSNPNPQDPIPLHAGASPVDGYVLIEELGGGGFGVVWRARGPGGVNVALKFVTLGRAHDSAEFRAIQLMKDVRHSNILGMSGVWQAHGYLIIALELGDCTLLDRFKQAQKQGHPGIPRDELYSYMLEAAKGIDYLNSKGIQHRDIKPQNLLLLGGAVKVADFGLVKLIQKSMTGHTGTLTPHYAAPEFFKGSTLPQSDQYSLAITYCLLRGGVLPFSGPPSEVMVGHLTEQPNLSMIPPEERPILERALAKEPTERWPSCTFFVKALMEHDESHPITEPALPIPAEQSPSVAPVSTGSSKTVRLPKSKTKKWQIALVVVGILLTLSLPVVLVVIGQKKSNDDATAKNTLKKNDPPTSSKPRPSSEKPTIVPSNENPSKEKPSNEKPGGEKPSGEKPAGEKPAGEKPSGEKPSGEKPSGEKPSGETPSGEKPASEKPGGEKPVGEKPDPKPPVKPDPVLTLGILDSIAIEAGKVGEVLTKVTREHFDGLVRLNAEGVPTGVTLKADHIKAGLGTGKLLFEVSKSAKAGKYDIVVEASYKELVSRRRLALTILAPVPPPKPASLDLDAISRVILVPNKANAVVVKVKRTNYDGDIRIRIDNLPKTVQTKPIVVRSGSNEGEVPLSIDTDEKPAIVEAEVVATSADGKVQTKAEFDLYVLGTAENSIGMKFTLIPPGKFLMGSPRGEEDRKSEETQHEVEITKPFFLGIFEVSQAEYEKLIDENPSHFSYKKHGKYTSNQPVDTVTWNLANEYCKKLSALEKKRYRLPTEAEWEYACRAGASKYAPFHMGDKMTGFLANIDGDYPYPTNGAPEGPYLKKTTPVGKYRKPNAWGLHDMHGNVAEWCADWWEENYYQKSPKKDPLNANPPRRRDKVIRGGHYDQGAGQCRSASREGLAPTYRSSGNGFRVLLEID